MPKISISGKRDMEEYPSEASNQAEGFDVKNGAAENYDLKDFCPGIRIEAKDFDGKWYPAKVSDVDWTENEILVHFENWNTKFDEWIPMDSSRLRPIQKPVLQQKDIVKFSKGEEVMAMWSPYQKYPATIQAVLSNDRYDVLFYDGFLKRLKSHKISKLEVGTAKNEVRNFSDIGTKEERRERKRKINVAELFHVNKRAKKKGLVHSKSQDIKTYPVSKSRSKGSVMKKQLNVEGTKGSTVSLESNETKSVDDKTSSSTEVPQTPKALLDAVPATFEVKYISGQTEMWSKQLYQRSEGRTAGKLDIVILNPQGRKFRSRNEIMKYCEENGIIYNHESFDFSAKGRPKSKSVAQSIVPKYEISSDIKEKTSLGLPKKGSKKVVQDVNVIPQSMETEISTPSEFVLSENTDQNKVFIGDFEVVIENGKFICPVKTCSKHFRRENLLHMHMKHYHPEFSKYLDYTPSVTDLAYARTVGNLDTVEVPSPIPKKLAAPDKTEKSVVKAETLRKSTETIADPIKETRKVKTIDNKSILRSSTDPTLSPAVPDEFREENVQKNKPSLSSFQTGKSNLNINEDAISTPENKGNSSENVKTEKPALNSEVVTDSHNIVKSVKHHKLHNRRKTSRFPGSFAEHMRKKKLLSQGHSRSQNKVGRHQLESFQQVQPSQAPVPSSSTENTGLVSSNQPHSVTRYPKPHLNLSNDISDQAEGTEDSKSPLNVEIDKVEKLRRNEIINCVCGIMEEDGLMIQCDLCLCWQHGHCAGILRELDVPEKYICTICKNPYRARSSMKYLHDQEWLKEGTLPSLSFRSKRDDIINQRKNILKRSHDLSGSIALLAQVVHSLRVKVNIAEKKDHPKLWLWAKKWTEKRPNRLKEESELKEEKQESNSELCIQSSGIKSKEDEKQLPKGPEPEAPIDSAECRLNLLDHLIHYQTLVDGRLSCIESLVAELESVQDDAVNDETPERYPRTKATVQMLLRDLNTMKKIAVI